MKYLAIAILVYCLGLITGCDTGPAPIVGPEETTSRPPPTEVLLLTPTPLPSPTPAETQANATSTVEPTLTLTGGERTSPTPMSAQKTPTSERQLRMVLIKANSMAEVEQLRKMRLDIVRVRSVDTSQPSFDKKSLSGELIVEAVVTKGMLSKLQALGFEVTEVP